MQRWASILVAACLASSAGLARAQAPRELVYVSRSGDTLSGIARRFLDGADSPGNLEALRQRNALRDADRLAQGVRVRLPAERVRFEPASARVVSAHASRGADGTPLAAGATLRAGDSVATDADGGVLLELANGTRVLIRDRSRAWITRLQAVPALDHTEATITLEAGRAESQVVRGAGGTRFEVRTPVATMGVRGTQFRAGLDDADGASRLEVLTGAVAAAGQADARATDIAAGFGAVVDRSGRAGAPLALLPAPELASLPALIEQTRPRFELALPLAVRGWSADVVERGSNRILATRRANSAVIAFDEVPDGDHTLVVRGVDAAGLEGFAAQHAFALRARPLPPLPVLPAPRATLFGDSLGLAWTRQSDAARYRVQARDAGGAIALDRELGTSDLTQALPPGFYRWRVATIDSTGRQGPFGPEREARLQPLQARPAAPALADDDTYQLEWPGSAGERFEVQIARDAAFSDIVLEQTVTAPLLRWARPQGGRYHIRLRSIEADQSVSPWSPERAFDVPTPPVPWWLWLLPLLVVL